jgi:microcystin-dependent protein
VRVDEALMAEIKLFAGNYPPKYWEFCQGQALPINENTALFSILGTQYGGDGMTTFNLPNLAPLTPLGADQIPINYVICVQGIYPQRHDQ